MLEPIYTNLGKKKLERMKLQLKYELVVTYCIAVPLYRGYQIFGMNMPFISSSGVKSVYFMSGEATHEIYIFSLQEMK